jgi:hypothetical protein
VGTLVLSGFTSIEADLMGAVGILTLDGGGVALDAVFPSVLDPDRTVTILVEIRVLKVAFEDRTWEILREDRTDRVPAEVVTPDDRVIIV